MRKMKLLAASAIAISAFALTPAKAAVNLITDGNFTDVPSTTTFVTIGGTSSFGPSNVWNVTGDSIDEIGNYWQSPPSGGGSVDLNGNGQGGITQSFNVANPGNYNLSFYLSGNPDGAPTTKEVTVDVGGVSQNFFYTLSGDKSSMNFVLEHLVFNSTGGSEMLSFASQDAGFYGAVIGGVSVSAVPEPATWTMLILGFGLIGASLRVNRRKATAFAA